MRAFLRPLFECKPKVLYKLAKNMCWRGYWAMHKFEKRMAKNEDYFPAFLMLSLTNKCNYNCLGCWVTKNSTFLSVDAVNDMIRQANKKGSYFFGLLGGEPLMYDGLLDVLRANPKCYFQIFTNGALLTEEKAREIAKIGNATVLISLEGMKEESLERRGSENAYDLALKAMENAKKAGLFWGVATSVCKNNYKDSITPKYLDFLAKKGANYVWYYIYRPVGALATRDFALSHDEIVEMRKFIVEARNSKSKLIIIDAYWDDKGRAICPAVTGMSHHISAGGDIEFCPPLQVASNRYKEGVDLGEVFAKSKFIKDLREFSAKQTRGCVLLDKPEELYEFLKKQDIYDSSGRGTFLEELGKMKVCAGHNIEEIPEKNFVYKFLKKKYFFGFGAYG